MFCIHNNKKPMQKITIHKFQMSAISFFTLLASNEIFQNEIIQIFTASKFNNVFWEFHPYDLNSTQNIAEFALIEASSFGKANSSSFKEYLKNKEDNQVVMFKNLSGDTNLITINSLNTKNQTFCHIMEFMKNSTHENKNKLLTKIGEEMLKYTNSTTPAYLSTHGHGIPWLHIRICNRPKYYASKYSEL